jgi:hypothetical protein
VKSPNLNKGKIKKGRGGIPAIYNELFEQMNDGEDPERL